MTLSRLFSFATTLFACICVISCEEKETGGIIGGGGVDPVYTPVLKGTSSFMGPDTENLIMYKTATEDEYVILGFFGPEDGGLAFLWDHKTNIITIEESASGLDSYSGPVVVITKKRYISLTGKEAEDSFYSPGDNIFSFQLFLEYGEADGTIIHLPVNAYFKPTETLSSN